MKLSQRRMARPSLGGMLATRQGALILAVLCAACAAGMLVFALSSYKHSVQTPCPAGDGARRHRHDPEGDHRASDRRPRSLYKSTPIVATQLAPGAISDASALQGQIAAIDILPGQQLTTTDFADDDRSREPAGPEPACGVDPRRRDPLQPRRAPRRRSRRPLRRAVARRPSGDHGDLPADPERPRPQDPDRRSGARLPRRRPRPPATRSSGSIDARPSGSHVRYLVLEQLHAPAGTTANTSIVSRGRLLACPAWPDRRQRDSCGWPCGPPTSSRTLGGIITTATLLTEAQQVAPGALQLRRHFHFQHNVQRRPLMSSELNVLVALDGEVDRGLIETLVARDPKMHRDRLPRARRSVRRAASAPATRSRRRRRLHRRGPGLRRLGPPPARQPADRAAVPQRQRRLSRRGVQQRRRRHRRAAHRHRRELRSGARAPARVLGREGRDAQARDLRAEGRDGPQRDLRARAQGRQRQDADLGQPRPCRWPRPAAAWR